MNEHSAGCDEASGWCDHDRQRSGCACGQYRLRCDCGETDEQSAALDRLGIAIDLDDPMASPERQWRLVAADLALEVERLRALMAARQTGDK